MSKLVYFATSNKEKVANAAIALKPYGIQVKQLKIELVESRAQDPADIALEKAKQAYKAYKHPVLVEDSGFFIRALGGFPSTHIKFSLSTLGVDNIIKMLKGVKDRHCEWRMTLAFVKSATHCRTFTCVEPGKIATAPREVKRKMMSDYWRIYIPSMEHKKNTLALSEMSEADLRAWQEYYNTHNQFQMFGAWYSKQK
ncbi:hypothetical protein KBA73_05500 [Patescibacteria group bacterium]|nr:hypothetical protein [Patescibacteria group bacterium]